MFVVRCEDGKVRHTQPFPNKHEAARFANWGHCCTNRHTYEDAKEGKR